LISSNDDCPFCKIASERVLRESDTCMTFHDGYPVTQLHTLVIPKRHVETYFDLSIDERRDLEAHLEEEKSIILADDPTVSGFNIGMNCGEDAGQTVMHCHVHLIPRRKGDIDNPKGGVRGVIPDKRIY
jgi:ATP adenylyltransferase